VPSTRHRAWRAPGLVSTTSHMTVVDLEAGLEHLSRGTARHVDTLLLIAERIQVTRSGTTVVCPREGSWNQPDPNGRQQDPFSPR